MLINKILLVRKGVLLLRFENLQDKEQVVKKGVYFFDSKPFMVNDWNPDMDLQTENIETLPL